MAESPREGLGFRVKGHNPLSHEHQLTLYCKRVGQGINGLVGRRRGWCPLTPSDFEGQEFHAWSLPCQPDTHTKRSHTARSLANSQQKEERDHSGQYHLPA